MSNDPIKVTIIKHGDKGSRRSSFFVDEAGNQVDKAGGFMGPVALSDLETGGGYLEKRARILEAWETLGEDEAISLYRHLLEVSGSALPQPGEASKIAYHQWRMRCIKPKRDYSGRRAASAAWLQERGLADG